MRKDLTQGGVYRNLVFFSLPYLLACFLQTFYGMADLFIIGQFNGAAIISAVSIGSQVMHMLTVIIVGLAMGTTIVIGRAIGAKNDRALTAAVGTSIVCFAGLSLLLTAALILGVSPILTLLSTPPEAVAEARHYLLICFAGIPFITAYNLLSSIFRGMGDTKSPMIFVGIAGVAWLAWSTCSWLRLEGQTDSRSRISSSSSSHAPTRSTRWSREIGRASCRERV